MRVFTGECDQRTISDSVSRARRALLPNVPWADVDTMKRHRQRLKASTPRRETLFRALAEYGTDFIHKDAYWLAGHDLSALDRLCDLQSPHLREGDPILPLRHAQRGW